MQSYAVAIVVGSYLIGSVPFSWIIGRLFAHDDIRRHGSGNVGATNVMRSAGKRAGAIALFLDMGKGWAAATLTMWATHLPGWIGGLTFEELAHARPWDLPSFWIGLASLLAVLGHMYPVWLHFRGGKGVATAAGVFLALEPRAFAVGVAIFIVIVLTTRYVSLGSMTSSAAFPLILRFLTDETFWIIVFSTMISLTIILKHHTNISRLADGTERKVGESGDER